MTSNSVHNGSCSYCSACRKFLRSSASLDNFHNIESFDSAEWLFHQEAYKNWQGLSLIDAKQALLTIKGKAFTGKSSMMKRAVDVSLKNSKVTTLHHFFGGGSEDATGDLLRDLLSQLLDALPYKNKPWEYIRRWSQEIADEQCVDLSSCHRLQNVITRLLVDGKDTLTVCVFVDAIDDCLGHSSIDMVHPAIDEEKPLRVLHILAHMLQSTSAAHMDLRICVSRRHLPDYYDREPPSTTVNLNQYMNYAIGPFIREKLQSIPDPAKVTQLLLQLSESGAHNFGWAGVICQNLVKRRSISLEELRKIASQVIDDHEAFYCGALRSSQAWLGEGGHLHLLHLLQIALGSFRRLTANEFRHAYAFAAKDEFEPPSMAAWETSDEGHSATDFEEFLSLATGGLLEIVTWEKTSRYAMNAQEAAESAQIRHNVSFLHRSTETFLRSDKGLQRLGIESQLQLETQCHLHMFKICKLALQMSSLRDNDDVHIVDYACEFWLRHARMCGELAEEIDLPAFMLRCKEDKEDQAQRFIQRQIRLLGASMSSEILYLEGETSMLVLLSTLGCTVLLRKHIRTCKLCKRALPHPRRLAHPSAAYLKALSNTIEVEQFETATYLLDLLPQQHVNVLLERDMTPLYQACYCHSISRSSKAKEACLAFVQALLARGADPCEHSYYDGTYQYPLHLAIASNNTPLIRVLCRGREREVLNNMLKIVHEPSGWPALHCAVKFNSERRQDKTRLKILQVLLDEAPEPAELLTLGDMDHKSALELAQEMHDEDTVELLQRYEESDEESDEQGSEESEEV